MYSGTNRCKASIRALQQVFAIRSMIAGLVGATLAVAPLTASAQPGWSNYGLYESQRRDAVAMQLGVQEHLRARSGLPSRLYPGLQPYSLESIYAGVATPLGARSWGSPHVFEPWPFVPGDIYGRQFDFGTQTPLGHVTTYTGPNSYTYEPYYAVPLAPPVSPPAAPSARIVIPPLEAPPAPVDPSPVPPLSAPSVPEELPPPAAEPLREF